MRLVASARALILSGLVTLMLAAWAGALVLIVFDWPVPEMLRGTAVGSLVWGCFYFFLDVRHQVPGDDAFGAPPANALIKRPRVLNAWLVVAIVACAGLAWLADRWELSAAMVPGQFAGLAAASLTGAVLSKRWERAHDGLVLLSTAERDHAQLYAATPATAQELAARR
jgi:hypothetical protein